MKLDVWTERAFSVEWDGCSGPEFCPPHGKSQRVVLSLYTERTIFSRGLVTYPSLQHVLGTKYMHEFTLFHVPYEEDQC